MYKLKFNTVEESFIFQNLLFKSGYKWVKSGRRISPFKLFSVNIENKTLNMSNAGEEISLKDFIDKFCPAIKFNML